jgi:hypothetical protein
VERDKEHELDEMLAERAISLVIHRYAHAADRGDVDLMESCFWPDATLDIGIFRGDAQAFVDGLRNAPVDPTRISRHLLGNILIEVNLAEGRARAETYCVGGGRMRDAEGRLVERVAHVRYVDRFEERNNEWRIHRRVVAFDWTTTGSVEENDLVRPEYTVGRRGPEDIWHHILDPE